MRTLLVIGIGAGDPEHMTVQAIKALNRAEVVFLPMKEGKDGLAELRREICRRYMERTDWRMVAYDMPERATADPSYRASVDDWHDAIARTWRALLRDELGEDGTGALLVWGDPSLYDSTLRLIDRLKAQGVDFRHEVIAGITSVQALAARHRVALNSIGGPVHVTTGRRLAEGFPDNADSVVVMLDGRTAFEAIDPDGLDIWWGANLGTDSEAVAAGPLAETRHDIRRLRERAKAKAGWVMDTYLLRRRATD